jgi:hypothetical protein
VRPEMRSLAGLAVTVPALLLSASCCCKRPPFLVGDAVSGGPDGYAFVKVAVTLGKNAAGTCRVLGVLPATVYVFPGSAIRWRVTNACDETGQRHLKFTRAVPRSGGKSATVPSTSGAQATVEGEAGREPFSFANCGNAEVVLGPQKDARNVLLCEVPENVRPGFYKYGLEGEIETYDPGLEVRPGGGK